MKSIADQLRKDADYLGCNYEEIAENMRKAADALLQPVPEGWRLVREEYEPKMGEVGTRYINSLALNGEHTLPAMFRWHVLWSTLLDAAAAPEGERA